MVWTTVLFWIWIANAIIWSLTELLSAIEKDEEFKDCVIIATYCIAGFMSTTDDMDDKVFKALLISLEEIDGDTVTPIDKL